MRKPYLGTILLVLWGFLLTVSVCVYLTWLQPSRLSSTVSYLLESTLNVSCEIGQVSLSIFPRPTFHVQDVSLRRGSMDSVELHVRSASARLSWFSLITLKPMVRSLWLENPTLDISGSMMESMLIEPRKASAQKTTISLPELPHAIVGVRIHIENGLCRLSSADGRNSLNFSGIDLSSRLPGLLPGNLELNIANIHYQLAAGLDLTADNTHFSLSSLSRDTSGKWSGTTHLSTSLQMGSLDQIWGRRISDPYRYFPMPKPLQASFAAEFSSSPENGKLSAHGRTAIQAVLPMNAHNVPIEVEIPFKLTDITAPIEVSNAKVRMEDDSATLAGQLTGLFEGAPLLKGRADIHHFSLTRWFGFGRLMDPGLQDALDNITAVFEDMDLSLKGVTVGRLTAQVKGIDLAGSGSCKEYLKPEILIDAHTAYADLNQIFPELRGELPDLSHLPPPVLPFSDSSEQQQNRSASSITIGYDIHISADKADVMNFQVGKADVHVLPAPQTGTMLDIKVGDVYGGSAISKVYLRDRIRIAADLKKVDLKGPSSALAGFPAITGLLKDGDIDISFEPGSGLHMLNTLGGSIKASMEKGEISTKSKASIAYRSFNVDVDAAAFSKEPAEMPAFIDYKGRWDVAIDTDIWAAKVIAPKGTLAFKTAYGLPWAMRDQSINLNLNFKKRLFPFLTQDLTFDASGKASFDLDRETASARNATMNHKDLAISGDVSFSDIFSRFKATGEAEATTKALRPVLAIFGLEVPRDVNENMLKRANLRSRFSVNSRLLELKELSGSIDSAVMTGNLSQTLSGRPKLSGSLTCPLFDLDTYLAKPDNPAAKSSTKARIPLQLLKNCDVDLYVLLGRLRAFETELANASLTLTQQHGTLSIPMKATFPGGGTVSSRLTAVAEGQYADIELTVSSRQVDMLAITQSRGQKTLLSGIGQADAHLRSKQRYWDDWKRELDGTLSMRVRNGALTSPTNATPEEVAQGRPAVSRTSFNSMSMNANAQKGIITCKDFLIEGTLLKVSGAGTVDLANEEIDAKASITVAGIPELPLTLKGDLFNPQTNYKLLGAVTGTVGNIGSTILDVVGTVLTAPLKFLMGNRPLRPSSAQ